MKKKKTKVKKTYNRLTLWLAVLVLGTIVGISIQFSRAWVEPSLNAPDGNIAAPINTGATEQTKVGTAAKKADICVDAYGSGDIKCLSSQVSWPKCTLDGGVPTMVEGGITVCKFPGASCPAPWKQYPNAPAIPYTETQANTCTGGGNCGNSVTSGSHSFSNTVSPVSEKRDYNDGSTTAYTCATGGYCGQWGMCYWDSTGGGNSCCHNWVTTYGTCYTSCNSTIKPCDSTVTTVGCVQ